MPFDAEYERRKQRALRRLRTQTPFCASCGNPHWQVLELHHLAGEAHDDATVILCRNCHRLLSDDQRDHPPEQASADPALERMGRLVIGHADYLTAVGPKLSALGRELIQRAQRGAPPADAEDDSWPEDDER